MFILMLQDKIKLVRKRSTELRVGPGQDMERRANLLVTEVIQHIIVVQIVPNKRRPTIFVGLLVLPDCDFFCQIFLERLRFDTTLLFKNF